MRMARSIAIAALALMLAGAAPADYGPEPDWDAARAMTEAAIRAKMIDPASTRIRWPYAFVPGSLTHFMDQARYGYWTCGRVDSRSRQGEYVGEAWFAVLINNDAIQTLDVGNPYEITTASAACDEAVRTGRFALAPDRAVSVAALADGTALERLSGSDLALAVRTIDANGILFDRLWE